MKAYRGMEVKLHGVTNVNDLNAFAHHWIAVFILMWLSDHLSEILHFRVTTLLLTRFRVPMDNTL
jgi:hypothetical protein